MIAIISLHFAQVNVYMLDLANHETFSVRQGSQPRPTPLLCELFICDLEAWLMDVDLAPCSLSFPFRIYQPVDVSWLPSCSFSTSCTWSTPSQDTTLYCQPLWSLWTYWKLNSELSSTRKSVTTDGCHFRRQSASNNVWSICLSLEQLIWKANN